MHLFISNACKNISTFSEVRLESKCLGFTASGNTCIVCLHGHFV